MFKEVSQNSLQNTCTGVSFLIKTTLFNMQLNCKETLPRRFTLNFAKFLRTPILQSICKQLLLEMQLSKNRVQSRPREKSLCYTLRNIIVHVLNCLVKFEYLGWQYYQ